MSAIDEFMESLKPTTRQPIKLAKYKWKPTYIPEPVHRWIKSYSKATGISLRDLVLEAILNKMKEVDKHGEYRTICPDTEKKRSYILTEDRRWD